MTHIRTVKIHHEKHLEQIIKICKNCFRAKQEAGEEHSSSDVLNPFPNLFFKKKTCFRLRGINRLFVGLSYIKLILFLSPPVN